MKNAVKTSDKHREEILHLYLKITTLMDFILIKIYAQCHLNELHYFLTGFSNGTTGNVFTVLRVTEIKQEGFGGKAVEGRMDKQRERRKRQRKMDK